MRKNTWMAGVGAVVLAGMMVLGQAGRAQQQQDFSKVQI